MIDIPEIPQPRPFQEWIDAFTMMINHRAEKMSDAKKLSEDFNIPIEQLPKYNWEADARMRRAWDRVRANLGSFGEDTLSDEVGVQGISPDGKAVLDKKVFIGRQDRNTGKVKTLIQLTDEDEVNAVGMFLQFYHWGLRTMDPRRYVRKTLEDQGVNKDNFDQLGSSYPVTNPFEEE